MSTNDVTLQRQVEMTRAISRDLMESGKRHGASLELLCFSAACWTNAMALELAPVATEEARVGIARVLRQAADAWDKTPRLSVRH